VTAEADWHALLRAESDYVNARVLLFEGDPAPVLRKGLGTGATSATDRRLAIRVLEEVGGSRPDVVRDLLPELFELTLGMHANSARVWRVIVRLDTADLAAALAPLVDGFLADPDRDAQEYWGLIALLDEATLRDARDAVLVAASASDGSDTRQVGQSWTADLNGRDQNR
jgi:hypothetical protein